jgi:hypothetical protein
MTIFSISRPQEFEANELGRNKGKAESLVHQFQRKEYHNFSSLGYLDKLTVQDLQLIFPPESTPRELYRLILRELKPESAAHNTISQLYSKASETSGGQVPESLFYADTRINVRRMLLRNYDISGLSTEDKLNLKEVLSGYKRDQLKGDHKFSKEDMLYSEIYRLMFKYSPISPGVELILGMPIKQGNQTSESTLASYQNLNKNSSLGFSEMDLEKAANIAVMSDKQLINLLASKWESLLN